MKRYAVILLALARLAMAQGTLPWGKAISVPLLATEPGVQLFYVASYSWNGRHTDYDMARQAADAYVMANPAIPTYLILNPGESVTCDDVPLPSAALGNGKSATLSIVGYGSNVSTLLKGSGCGVSAATLAHGDPSGGPSTNAWYQGFTIDANRIDMAACGMYGLSASTFFDVSCGDAAPGADHEMEFGNSDANSAGLVSNVYLYNLKAFGSIGSGKGAVLTPVWTNGALTAATVANAGTKSYSQQYTRAQIVGPGLSSCAVVPTLVPIVSDLSSGNFSNIPPVTYGYLTGATITNPGSCSNTSQLYILIQDGLPVTYGMKFTNMTGSHIWNLESTATATYAEAWLQASGNNAIIGEHPYTNQTIEIADYSSGNKHTNAFFDSPGEFGALISAYSGSFVNSIYSWDSSSYTAASGYYFSGSPTAYSNWIVQNSQCTNSTANFISITTSAGPLANNAPAPAGVNLMDIEACDGTNSLNWAAQVSP